MKILDFDAIPDGCLEASAVTVGNFDGVHIGHREIIGKVIGHARRIGAPSVVITFDPHPREVIVKGAMVPAIIPFSERTRLISELGVDILAKVNFTPEFAEVSAESFIDGVVRKLKPEAVVIGHDFRFGQSRKGDGQFLARKGERYGFVVEVVPAVEFEGQPVSSSRIRKMIQDGEMRRVRKILGAPFHLEGEVIAGHGRGKAMGFATANLKWEALLIPPDGVYSAVAWWNDHRCPAVVNIGDNPTFGDTARSIEAHVMGYAGDLYGKRIRIALVYRLREEIKFNSPEELVAQITKDVEKTRRILNEELGEDLFCKADPSPGRAKDKRR